MTLPLFPDAESPSELTPELVQPVAAAMALLWTYRHRSTQAAFARAFAARLGDGTAISAEQVQQAFEALERRGWLVRDARREGYFRLCDEARVERYRELLETVPAEQLRRALFALDNYRPDKVTQYWPLYDRGATVGIVRLMLFTGAPPDTLAQLRLLISRAMDWDGVLIEAALAGFDPASFERITAQWRWDLAYWALYQVNSAWSAAMVPIGEWALGQCRARSKGLPEYLRLAAAEFLLHRGRGDEVLELLQGLDSGHAQGLRAGVLVQASRWHDAQAAFAAAFKQRQTEVRTRKHLLPDSVSWLYPLALLAQQTPRALQAARKFCRAEAGARDPSPFGGWGRWLHAIDARAGELALDAAAFEGSDRVRGDSSWDDLWRLLLASWLGPETLGIPAPRTSATMLHGAGAVRERLQRCGFAWLIGQLDAAVEVLEGREPPAGYFAGGRMERWREVLAALEALGTERTDTIPATTSARIVWSIRIGKDGRLEDIEPLEQRRGARGWNKPRPIALARLARASGLAPYDAKVMRAVRQSRLGARYARLDRAAAIVALIGHPTVVLAHRPEQLVDLVEAGPTLEVVKTGERLSLRVEPPLRIEAPEMEDWELWSSEERREAEALRLLTLVEEAPRRVRVIRFTPAQRRAAQLLASEMSIPLSAEGELQPALRALAAHFEVHADHVAPASELPAESRLRAELAPEGGGLHLRLVATPLGPEGPRLRPGSGRARLLALVAGENAATTRDLAAEQSHLNSVLEALPFLELPELHARDCEWTVDDPEHALTLVEVLPQLAAVAGIDWPKGKSVRVLPLDGSKLAINVASERDWFRLSGQVNFEQGLALTLESLLEAARGGNRFVPMGDGVYAALTQSLKERLSDLAVVAESSAQGTRIAKLAAVWLAENWDDTLLDADGGYRATIERLRAAQAQAFQRPQLLQAELRRYQEEGYAWAMRLATAGFGGCLADDMGLGKTLQALAVLLSRAAGGAALVVAPTSVCGNWFAEAARFAPSLHFQLYAQAERAGTITGAGPFDVVLVSYTLLQQDGAAFAGRHWHTVVLDEAQAIKNAAAKRSQAVFALEAGFKLALSGTPVENRLVELWSVMRFVNPGLLGSLERFNQRFAAPIERDRDRAAQHRLRRLISPFVLRRTKAQVLHDLPPRTEVTLSVALEADEAAHYEALRRQALKAVTLALASSNPVHARFNVLVQLTRLRRAACDPRLVSPELGLSGAKVQAFAELALELVANGHKALVFSQFVDFLQLLRAPLDAAGIRYQYLDGSTPAAERTRRVDAFQAGEGEFFLISLKAGGFGLNLTAADYVVITDPWWNPAVEDQAAGRAHRIGQQRPVTVYRLVAQGTIEQRIVELHHDKRQLAESILAEGETGTLPPTEELIALLTGAADPA